MIKSPHDIVKATDCRSDIFCPQQASKDVREQINGITAFVDGSNIYGSNPDTNIGLREEISKTLRDGRQQKFPSAKLKTNNDSSNAGGQMHLPRRAQCGFALGNPNPTADDLTAGDVRAVEQPTLTSIHTLFLNEHNRIVEALELLVAADPKASKLSPYETQEFVFQVSRNQCFTMQLLNMGSDKKRDYVS